MAYSYDDLLADDLKLSLRYRGVYRSRTLDFTYALRRVLHCSIGNGKRRALYIGAHHGREHITSMFLVAMMRHVMDVETGLLSEYTLDFLPMLNPDGVAIASDGLAGERERGFLESVLKQEPHVLWKSNGRGVDINRNYPALWEDIKTEPGPSPMNYRGEYPASEVETRCAMNLCKNAVYEYAVTMHARGEVILYADFMANPALSKEAAQIAAKLSGFEIMPPTADRAMMGGFENWFRSAFKRPCLLIELCPSGDGPYKDPASLLKTERYRALLGLAGALEPLFRGRG